jgi:UDP-glucose 4-epimerase
MMVAASGGTAKYTTREFPADRARIDIGSYHADDGAFRAAAGWAPRVGLEEGIRRSLEWFRTRLPAYL